MKKIILDLCGGTGSWSKPYKDNGYHVINITLPDYDITQTELRPQYNDMIFKGEGKDLVCGDIYGILAAPPCTEFSLAKNDRPRNFTSGLIIVRACLEIVWHCRIAGELKWWGLENPRCFLRQFLGKPAFTFEHWEFGDKGIKPTDIWGYFNKPRKLVKKKPEGLSQRFPNKRINAIGWSKSATKRAITPPSFAQAFFEANR